jgi:membrane fusion protein, multidrug efflux system
MRPLLLAAALIVLLILGKVFFFTSDADEKGGGGGGANGGGAGSKNMGKGGPGAAGKMGDGKPIKVKTLVISMGSSVRNVFSSGTTVANESVEIRSEVAGKIVKLNIPEGSVVPKGYLIAKIKDDDILAQLKKIELEQLLASQIEARQKKLLDINAISREEFEISQNKVLTLNADKEMLQVQLSRTEIRAPFAGKVGLKAMSLGAYVTPANTITTITQFNPIKLDFTVPEKYIRDIKLGKDIKFLTDGSVAEYNAKVIAIDPKIDEALRTLRVRAIASNPGSSLLPGMFVKVNLNINTEAAIMIPTETVIPVAKGKKVFVKRNGVVEEIMIETGIRDASMLQVTKGLQVGDSLITSGLMTLKAGGPVTSLK